MQSYALPGSTARQLFNSSTLLDSSTARHRSRQNSTDLDTPAHAVSPRLASTGSTATPRSYSTGSTGKALTAPRQWPRQRSAGSTEPRDSSTARQPGLKALLSMVAEHSRTNQAIWISVKRDQLARRLFLRPLCTTPFSFAVPYCPLSRAADLGVIIRY